MKKTLIFYTVFMIFILSSITGCNKPVIDKNHFSLKADKYLLENDFTGAVLVAKNNKIIFAKGYGLCDSKNPESEKITPDTVFETGSLTKQMTAAAILQLVKKHKIKTDDKITKYLPDLFNNPDDIRNEITIRQLLNMRSGLTDHINSAAEFFPRDVFRAVEANQIACKPVSQNLVLNYLPSSPILAKPDSTYFYCNTNYYLLAKIIEKAQKKSYHDYMNKNILKKCRMTSSNFDFQKTNAKAYTGGRYYSIPSGLSLGCGDLNSSVNDLYRWNCAFLSGKVIPKKYIRELKKSKGYNYGFYCGNGMIFHAGNTNVFNSYNCYNFNSKTQIIVLCNAPAANCNATKIAGELNKLLK